MLDQNAVHWFRKHECTTLTDPSHDEPEIDFEVSKVIPVFHSTIPFQWNSPLIHNGHCGSAKTKKQPKKNMQHQYLIFAATIIQRHKSTTSTSFTGWMVQVDLQDSIDLLTATLEFLSTLPLTANSTVAFRTVTVG